VSLALWSTPPFALLSPPVIGDEPLEGSGGGMREHKKTNAETLIGDARKTELKILSAMTDLPPDKMEQLWLYLQALMGTKRGEA